MEVPLGRDTVQVEGRQLDFLLVHGAAAPEVGVALVQPWEGVGLTIVAWESELRPMRTPPVVGFAIAGVAATITAEGAAAATTAAEIAGAEVVDGAVVVREVFFLFAGVAARFLGAWILAAEEALGAGQTPPMGVEAVVDGG